MQGEGNAEAADAGAGNEDWGWVHAKSLKGTLELACLGLAGQPRILPEFPVRVEPGLGDFP
jgi:hypothetical protein